MTNLASRMQFTIIVLAVCLACHRRAGAQPQTDTGPKRDVTRVELHTAPDETSPPAAAVPRGEIIMSPLAQIVGTGGAKWYLVKTKSGAAGWINGGDAEISTQLEPFFKPLPAELSVAAPVELSSSAANSAPSNAIVIPIQMNGTAVVVPVLLNRTVQAHMILDTGASFTVVSQQLAGRLGLKPTRRISLVTANGTVGAPLAPLGSLKIGDAEVTNLTVIIQDVSPALDGLLGLDFLSRYHTTIDSRRQLLVLAPR